METIIPVEIVTILQKMKGKLKGEVKLTETETKKLDSFLCTLEEGIINPVDKKSCLVNPVPLKPDIGITREETMIDRIRHINTVSARVRESYQPNSEEEIQEFLNTDLEQLDDHPVAKSIFTVADHEVELEPEVLTPSEENIGPNPDLESGADPLPPDPDNGAPV